MSALPQSVKHRRAKGTQPFCRAVDKPPMTTPFFAAKTTTFLALTLLFLAMSGSGWHLPDEYGDVKRTSELAVPQGMVGLTILLGAFAAITRWPLLLPTLAISTITLLAVADKALSTTAVTSVYAVSLAGLVLLWLGLLSAEITRPTQKAGLHV